jgi:hypothetical protein
LNIHPAVPGGAAVVGGGRCRGGSSRGASAQHGSAPIRGRGGSSSRRGGSRGTTKGAAAITGPVIDDDAPTPAMTPEAVQVALSSALGTPRSGHHAALEGTEDKTSTNGATTNGGAAPCKFGVACTRPDCIYAHPPSRRLSATTNTRGRGGSIRGRGGAPTRGRGGSTRGAATATAAAAVAAKVASMATGPCHFGVRCTRADCHFTHPPERQLNSKTTSTSNGSIGNGSNANCRYDPKCNSISCTVCLIHSLICHCVGRCLAYLLADVMVLYIVCSSKA